MKIVRCQTPTGIKYGALHEGNVRFFASEPYLSLKTTKESVPLNEVTLLAPCVPSKIVAVGINYAQHAKELDSDIPVEPLIFLKPATAVIGPDQPIVLPEMSRQVDYEGELAVVMGRLTKNVSELEALDHVLGYTCFNDVTARDLQKRDVQFTRSKSFDTFAPIGPWIETEIDPSDLAVCTTLNSEQKQSSRTGNMIRSVETLISYISKIMTLLPGDIIATGTPEGVGKLNPGDRVSVTIENIGTLTNKVVNYDQV
ncbi:MAG: fumarylacetoacetate hydrolase family protein [Desulfobulbaceae bacterium]|nr:fumarylacetoacetate hydrolase family protein [Desulfobulbaceae bacterium]